MKVSLLSIPSSIIQDHIFDLLVAKDVNACLESKRILLHMETEYPKIIEEYRLNNFEGTLESICVRDFRRSIRRFSKIKKLRIYARYPTFDAWNEPFIQSIELVESLMKKIHPTDLRSTLLDACKYKNKPLFIYLYKLLSNVNMVYSPNFC